MARTAVIRTATGLVENVIELEPESADWAPPDGHFIRVAEDAGPGDTWDGIQFIKPPAPAPPLTLTEQLGPLAQPLVDNIETLLNARNPAQPVTGTEKDALRRKVLHLVSRGEIPA